MSDQEVKKAIDDMFKDEGAQKPGERVLRSPTPEVDVMSNVKWEGFCKGELVNFLIRYNLQKIQVEDGTGKKGVVKLNSHGEYVVQGTYTEKI